MIKRDDKHRSLMVFTQDLRLDDHALLSQACAESDELMLLYCLEPRLFASPWQGPAAMGTARFQFLAQSLADLNQQLKFYGQHLVVQLGNANAVIDDLQQQHHFTHIYQSQQIGFDERQQWQNRQTTHPEVTFCSQHTGQLYAPSQLPFEIENLPKHFTPFRKLVEEIPVPAPVAKPVRWPAPIATEVHRRGDWSDAWLSIHPAAPEGSGFVGSGFEGSGFVGGMAAGQHHLANSFGSTAPSSYKKMRNELLGWDNSTKFSPWLALGCFSPKQVVKSIKQYEAQHGANESTYWIHFELLWREFFHWYAIKHGATLFQSASATESANPLQSQQVQQRYLDWCLGDTGEPLIDACMRQLYNSGYLSNRGRQIAASYLIHELALDWRAGASHFERWLIDYDVASNWGNWQYIAGVGADPRGGRHFNTEKQQNRFDPDGQFIDRWSVAPMTRSVICWDDLVKGLSS